jgi:hypothetical protein
MMLRTDFLHFPRQRMAQLQHPENTGVDWQADNHFSGE